MIQVMLICVLKILIGHRAALKLNRCALCLQPSPWSPSPYRVALHFREITHCSRFRVHCPTICVRPSSPVRPSASVRPAYVYRPTDFLFSLSRSLPPSLPARPRTACKGTWFLRQCQTVSRPHAPAGAAAAAAAPSVRHTNSPRLLHAPHVRKNDAPRARARAPHEGAASSWREEAKWPN